MRELPVSPERLRALAARQPKHFPVLFDSAVQGALGRYSILAALPRATLRLRGDGRLEHRGVTLHSRDFLGALDEWWQREQTAETTHPGPVPFRGGWVVYLGYELAGQIEVGLGLPNLPAEATVALATRVQAALVYDHEQQRCFLVTEPAVLDEASAVVAAALEQIGPTGVGSGAPALCGRVREAAPELFQTAVLRAQQYIVSGDIYQANLSRAWAVKLTAGERALAGVGTLAHDSVVALSSVDTGALYERLRWANPAPFAVYATLPSETLLCSSPERLVRVKAGWVETRPIAGTRARAGTTTANADATDPLETRELLANPKERAEQVMLIDLERNDLGRICEAGTVEVNEFMVTESYPHLHHIVSNVRGRRRVGVTPGATLRAVFPGGTITGCPKYRCMQIIGELEAEPRGAYTGSIGYLNLDGEMDFNILIRTATVRGTELSFRTGGGIVADSEWSRELAETRAKAKGMLRAFGTAETDV